MSSLNLNLDWVKRPAVFGTILGTVLIAIVWWMAWMSPQASKLTSVDSQQTQAQGQITVLQGEISSLKAQSAQLTKELPYLKFFQSQIPPLPLQGELTSQLYQLSLQTHTFISSLSDNTVEPATATTAGYSTMPISIQLGGSHNGVLAFLQGLYHLQRLITIQQISLVPPSGQPNLNSNGNANGFAASITATAYTTYIPVSAAPSTTTSSTSTTVA